MKEGMVIGASNIVDLVFESVFSKKLFSETDAKIFPEIDSVIKKVDELRFLMLHKKNNSVSAIGKEILESYQNLIFVLNGEINEVEIKEIYLLLDLKVASSNHIIKKVMSNILVHSVIEFVKYYEPCIEKRIKKKVQHYITQIEMNFTRQISEELLVDV